MSAELICRRVLLVANEAGTLLDGRSQACGSKWYGQVGGGTNMHREAQAHQCLRPLPDKPILSSTPECVGPHGCRGNALHPVCVVSKHVDRFLYCQVVDMHLGVGCPRDQDAVPSVRQELLRRD